MEHEINQYLAQQREMTGDRAETRRDRRDYSWERNPAPERRRHRSRPSRFNDADEDLPVQIPPRGDYEQEAETKEYRPQEAYQGSRRSEPLSEEFNSSSGGGGGSGGGRRGEEYGGRRSDEFGDRRPEDRYEDSRRHPRGDEARPSRGRYGDAFDERAGERRGDRHEDRYGGRRGDRDRPDRSEREHSGDRGGDRDRGDRDRDRGERYGDSRDRGPARKEKPSRTVMLKNLHSSVTDHDIRAVLQLFGGPIKDVRLVKHRDTGVSRGFAFVEFQFLPDAQRWMKENQGRIVLAGQDTQLVYSSNKDREEDWFCSQCGTHNFKRREYCFKCSISKDDSEKYSEIGDVASNVLILMGLDALTTEETVTKILEYISSAKMAISVARDPLTRTSRGYCYVEMSTVETATHLMNILASMQPPFQIDGKQVSVHFCKQSIPDTSATASLSSMDTKWSVYGSQASAKTSADNPAAAEAYYQEATLQPAKLAESQTYDYLTGAPVLAGYQAQSGLLDSQAVATEAAGPAERDQYKAAVAQEQVQAARRLQLQHLQQQQLIAAAKLQGEPHARKTAAAQSTADKMVGGEAAAAGTTTAAATADPAEDQEVLAEKARQWSEEKKRKQRRREEAEEEGGGGRRGAGREDREESAAAVATAKKKKRRHKDETSVEALPSVVPRIFQEGLQYPTPDVSAYVYDDQSGYYYDASIGLYYDASSQYYYNSITQKYLYWDMTSCTYLPAPEAKTEAQQAPAGSDKTAGGEERNDKAKDKDKKNDKNKMAKKLVKDMARWAKSMNSSKANASKKSGAGGEGAGFGFGAADAGFAMLMKKANPADTKAALQHVLQKQTSDPGTGAGKLGVVASYGGGSDSEPEPDIQPSMASAAAAASGAAAGGGGSNNGSATSLDALTDWDKLICLLCKRQFPSREILVKHQQFSELHKQNLETLQQGSQEGGDQEMDYHYRDRAKERRQKFGMDDPPPKKKFRPPKPSVPYEEPTKEGLKEDNIGNQMLQKMGWNKGTGLGKKAQGRTDPIQVQKRQAGAGLGIKGGNYDISATDTYRDAVKKVMRNRFEEME